MLYYCTLFDSNYISKGIALYLSLERHTDDFLLYVMAMDRKCEKMLKNISRKTKCSTFAKHFVPKSHLLTQFKM